VFVTERCRVPLGMRSWAVCVFAGTNGLSSMAGLEYVCMRVTTRGAGRAGACVADKH